MTDTATATVETLTAEVRTLVVGSRQVTMSVYSQLDFVEPDEIEAWGRVRPRDGLAGWIYLVGRRIQGGDLVRSGAPASEQAIGNSLNWHRQRTQAEGYERKADAAAQSAEYREERAEAMFVDHETGQLAKGADATSALRKEEAMNLAQAQALRQEYHWKAVPLRERATELEKLPLIVLAGLR
jgi:hypothetical protein